MTDALEAIAARLPRRLALELLETAETIGPVAFALELAQHEDTATFARVCDRLARCVDLREDARIARLVGALSRDAPQRAALVARAELERTGTAHSAMAVYRVEALLGDEAAGARALDHAAEHGGDARRIAIERLRSPEHPIAAIALTAKAPRDRLLVLAAALHQSRAKGRYARVSALDGLLELLDLHGAVPGLGRACLRAALEHVDALGDGLSELELDRIRTLHRRVAPALVLGPPLDVDAPPSAPTELELRAREALRGAVRGELPKETHPDHAAALAITALAHLIGAREDAALPLLSRLSAVPSLPRATWAVVHAASTPRARRACASLAVRAAAELAPPTFALVPLARRFEPHAARALLLSALARHEPEAASALTADVEREAMALRNAGQRPVAILLLTQLEKALAGDAAARATLLRARRVASAAQIP